MVEYLNSTLRLPAGNVSAEKLTTAKITWRETGNATYPYQSRFEDSECLLRVEGDGGGPPFTLIVSGQQEAGVIEEWPRAWLPKINKRKTATPRSGGGSKAKR